jgi:REP element-mobilizing transposase RayT
MEVFQIHQDTPVYYLTFTIVHWLPVFIAEDPCLIITDSLNYCHTHKQLRINAFVIMPTHLHLIAFDADFDSQRLRQTLMEMRKFTGRRLSDYCLGKWWD